MPILGTRHKEAALDEALPPSVETVVIGAGQAGLIASWYLQRAGREHIVVERRETLGGGWQDRWDGFRLVSPNWISALPGMPYDGDDPDEFMDRTAIVARTREYARLVGAPVRPGTAVQRLSPAGGHGRRFHLETSRGPIDTDDVISATGAFHVPRIPAMAGDLSPRVLSLHAHDYRNPAQLPPGGVLLIGSGQTGVQLAEELHEAGREVVLSVGACGRVPRRYRGKDYFWWIRRLVDDGERVGTPLRRVDQLPNPRAKFAGNPHLSGHRGGHDTNLRQMGLDGIRLTGRAVGAAGEVVRFAPDLGESLRFADGFFDDRFRPIIDAYAERTGLAVSEDDRAWPSFEPPEVAELDLAAEGIGTVLWTTGYRPDYDWLDLPILDEFGVPRHVRGVTEVPGLTFIGMLWQLDNASANLAGVERDVRYLASRW
jgi:putative flavoprotein involved in K+ transport